MDNQSNQLRLMALAGPIGIVCVGISVMAKLGHFNLLLALFIGVFAYLIYRRGVRNAASIQKHPTWQRQIALEESIHEYGPSQTHERLGKWVLGIMVAAQALCFLIYGTRTAFLAPLILFVPAYIAIGVSAPKHRTDLLGGFARRLLLSSLVLAGIAVGSIFLPGEQLSLTVFRGGITLLAVLLGASQAILVIRQKRGLAPKS